MFSDKVGELWVELSAKKGNVADAFRQVREDYDKTTKVATQYTQLINSQQVRPVFSQQAEAYKAVATARLAQARAQAEFLNSTEGQDALREQASLQKQLNQAQAAQSWAKLVAEQGKSRAMLTLIGGTLKTIKGNLAEVVPLASMGFGTGVSWIERMAAAASPAVWRTFTGSLQLLSATIGTMFTPYLIEASLWIQRASRWVRDLDPATRNMAAGWIVAGVAMLGIVTIGYRVVTMLVAIGSAMRAIGLLNPYLLAAAVPLAAIASSVASTSAATDNERERIGPLYNRGDRNAQVQQAFLQRTNVIPGFEIGTNLAASLENRNRLPGNVVPTSGIGAWLGGLFGGTGSAEQRAQQLQNDRIQRWIRQGFTRDEAVAAIQNIGTPAAFRAPARPASGDERSPNFVGPPRPPRQRTQSELLTDTGFQSSTFGIEDQFRRMQQAAASMSPLQAELTRVQVQGLDQLLNNTGAEGPIAHFLNDIFQLLGRRPPGGLQ